MDYITDFYTWQHVQKIFALICKKTSEFKKQDEKWFPIQEHPKLNTKIRQVYILCRIPY